MDAAVVLPREAERQVDLYFGGLLPRLRRRLFSRASRVLRSRSPVQRSEGLSKHLLPLICSGKCVDSVGTCATALKKSCFCTHICSYIYAQLYTLHSHPSASIGERWERSRRTTCGVEEGGSGSGEPSSGKQSSPRRIHQQYLAARQLIPRADGGEERGGPPAESWEQLEKSSFCSRFLRHTSVQTRACLKQKTQMRKAGGAKAHTESVGTAPQLLTLEHLLERNTNRDTIISCPCK